MGNSLGSKPKKRSVAVMVRRGPEVLTLRRSDNEGELPGVWGLPAGSYRERETLDELVRRIGRDKLGVRLTAGETLLSGVQERSGYVLDMELVEAGMDGVPMRGQWKWDRIESLEKGMRMGSLCCALALRLDRD